MAGFAMLNDEVLMRGSREKSYALPCSRLIARWRNINYQRVLGFLFTQPRNSARL